MQEARAERDAAALRADMERAAAAAEQRANLVRLEGISAAAGAAAEQRACRRTHGSRRSRRRRLA